jgi:cellobiose phosphorylase
MYRVWVEEVLGFQRRGKSLLLRPVIPASWPGFKVSYRYENTKYQISVVRTAGTARVELDGAVLIDGIVMLQNDGSSHNVVVHVPQAESVNSSAAKSPADDLQEITSPHR